MHSGEPHLFEGLPRQSRAPKIVAEIAAPLVNRNRMAPILHIGVLACVGQPHRIPNVADGTHRIPDADQMRRTVAAESILKTRSHSECVGHASGVARAL